MHRLRESNRGSQFEYKCPECGGEFNDWDVNMSNVQRCPFCLTKKGNYGGDS